MDAVPARRWFHLTPDRLIVSLLAVEGFLLLSERFRCFAFNEMKGLTVLIALASVGVVALLMSLWLAAGLLFRWRFQFSMRSLLVMVVAVAVPCRWLAVEMKEAEKQKRAVEAISKAGVDVYYDYQFDATGSWTGASWGGPTCVRNWFGEDFVADVVGVQAPYNVIGVGENCYIGSDCKATDEDLLPLKTFSTLRVLDLAGTRVTDSCAASFEGLVDLRSVSLWQTCLSDKGIAHLRRLRNLKYLNLRHTKTTNSGLVHLKDLPRLEYVALGETAVDDDGLMCLTACKQLREVDLWRERGSHQFTPAGIARFQRAFPGCKVTE